MSKRITSRDCDVLLYQIADRLVLPILDGYKDYSEAPGNALLITGYDPEDRSGVRCRIETKDGRTPWGSQYCLGYRELYEKLETIQQTLRLRANLGLGGMGDYSVGF